MRTVRSFILPALCLLGCLPVANAQFIVTYQGFNGTDSDVGIYDPTTNELVATFYDPGVFKVLSNSTGTDYYFISNAPNGTAGSPVFAIGTFNTANHLQFGTFATPVTSAVLAPNDQYLIVGESKVHIFAATKPFNDLAPGPFSIPNAINTTDLAVDYNSTTIYALSAGAGGSYLTSISLPSEIGAPAAIVQTVSAPAGSTFLTLAPNGLLYISSPNTITEINPLTLTPTTNGTLTVPIVNPGRPVFTPAGQYLVVADQSPVAGGSAAVLVDLNLHAVTGTLAYNGLNDPITQLNVLSDTQLYGLVQGTTTLYQLLIGTNGGLILNPPPFAANLGLAANPGAVTDVAGFSTSQDLGVPGRNAPQYVFLSGNLSGYIYEIDPVSLQIVDQISWSASNFSAPDGVSYTTPTNVPTATPTTVLLYGNEQTVPLGGQTLPIVFRVLDQNGNPMDGQSPNCTLTPVGGTASPVDGVLNPPPSPSYPPGAFTEVFTGNTGYAEIYMTAGTLSTDVGANGIDCSIGSLQESVVVNVGTSAPAAAATLTIVSGQGQVIFQNPNPNPEINPDTGLPYVPLFASTPVPLTVLATDSSGNPLAGVPVVFQVISSNPTASPGAMQAAVTDSTGQAAASFPGIGTTPFSPPFASDIFATETITATSGTLSTNFYLTSVLLATVTGVSCVTPPCVSNVPLLNIQVLAPAYGSSITGSANSTIPNAVKIVVTSLPNYVPIPNVGVGVNTGTLTTQTNARCSEPTGSGIILTDSTGTAVCNLLLNNIPGTQPLSIFVPPQASTGVSGFATLTVTSNAAATVNIISGNNQYQDEGSTSLTPLTVQVVDASNNPIVSAPVTWQVVSGPVTLNPVETITDTNGMATATPIAQLSDGAATVTATSGSASATFTEDVAATAGDLVVVSGNNQTVPINSAAAAPLVVQVLDTNGNPAPFSGVTFSVSSTVGTFAGTTPASGTITVTADANGNASASFTASSIGGAVTVTAATVDTLASTFFSLTILSPNPSSLQVVNAGSLLTNLSPGTLVNITGNNVASSITGTVTDPSTLLSSGYSVSVAGVTAPITQLMNVNGVQQVTAQIPFEVTPGATTLTLQTPQGSGSADITVSTLSPAILTNGTVTVNGSMFPLALATRPDGSTVSATNPAQQGDMITLSATGLGQTTPTAVTGNVGVPDQIVYAPLFMAINHLGATVTSAVYTTGTSGTYSIVVQIPSTAMIGPGQPISLYEIDSTGLGYNAPDVYIPIVAAQ